MKVTINKKRYDSNKCEILGTMDHYSHSNNYSGTTHLLRASNGQLLVWCYANGQDLYLSNYMCSFEDSEYSIDDFDMTDDQEKRCVELGLIEVIE